MNIDVDESKKKLRALHAEGKSKLKLLMFGGSLLLFPQPVKELSEVAAEIGAIPCYDAAHVAGLIAGGEFQDPLREGAHLMTFSTHKTLFGPQGGTIVAKAEYGEGIKKAVFPGYLEQPSSSQRRGQGADVRRVPEIWQGLRQGCRQRTPTPLRSAARAGRERGRGGHRLHQVPPGRPGRDQVWGRRVRGEEARVHEHNRQQAVAAGDLQAGRHYTNPGGVRLGVSELTRLGMKKGEMQEVAELLHLALTTATRLRSRNGSRLAQVDQKVHYSFNDSPAYFYH